MEIGFVILRHPAFLALIIVIATAVAYWRMGAIRITVSEMLLHPAFLALIPVLAAIRYGYRGMVKNQETIMVNVNGNTSKLIDKIDELIAQNRELVALLATANKIIARLEKALGHKEGEEEAGHIGKSKNGGGH